MKRSGRKSAAQTPAPKSERIYGSKVNPKGSAQSKSSASKIKLSQDIINTLSDKAKKYNESHPKNKVSVSTLKAVFRRGAGAYSKTHRPTISGGAPNSRSAWAFARVNKFLEKKSGKQVKKAYVQDDDLMKDGGITNQNVVCHRCGWMWDTNDSAPNDKYVCHKCGFDNSWYYGDRASLQKKNEGGNMKPIALPDAYSSYDHLKPILEKQGYILKERGGNLPVGKLAKGMTLSEVAALHGLKAQDLKKELNLGIETEMEHTDDPEIARAIAMDHLYEDAEYYTKLKKMEGVDKHLVEISKKYAEGGEIHEIYSFKTPTGEKSRLSYLQQVLVRTKSFKDFFGDWESAAKSYILDNKENFQKHYKNVSKVLDMVTLEPRVVYHGTRAQNEFYHFDVTKEVGVGRPYGYFAHNKEYSENFTKFSQRTTRETKPLLYECFVNIRNPFMALGQQYELKSRDSGNWKSIIAGTISWDKYGTIEKGDYQLEDTINEQIGSYLDKVFTSPRRFWMAMANDTEKDFKFFLMAYGYDGIFYSEEYQTPFDETKPDQYTKAVCIFDSKQVKLADGRNLNFDPLVDDIRYDEGGEVEDSIIDQTFEVPMNRKMKLGAFLFGKEYAEGGEVIANDKVDPNDGKKGGYFKGRSHADGGIKAINVDTGQLIEVEGEEVIITKGAVNDNTKREFEGEMLTNREILSRINQSGGGVSFEEGGEINSCGCSGKRYKYGGELMEDYRILRKMNEPLKIAQENMSKARSYVDDLVAKMK